MNNWVEGGHQPLWPETYARMPPEVQRLMPGVHARERDHRYEWQLVERPPLPDAGAEEGYAGAGAAEPLSDDEIAAAVEHLSTFGKHHHLRKVLYDSLAGLCFHTDDAAPTGYTVLEGRIVRELALEMAAAFLAHHTPDAAEDMHGAGDAYQTLFGMLNRDDRTWTCAAHR